MELKKTITSIFMVPTLKIPRNELKNNGFLNGYSRDNMREVQYDNAIYLLFRPTQVDKFREFLDSEYERTRDIIDDYDYPDGFVVVVYRLDQKYKDDYALVRQGKYSRTSSAFQEEFTKSVTIMVMGVEKEELSLQYRVFNKTEDLVSFWEKKFDVTFGPDQEIWHGFEEEKETLTTDTLKQFPREKVNQKG